MPSPLPYIMKQLMDIAGIILAGGKNSRMGMPKAFLEINGTRLIDKILAIYRTIFSEIIIVTNDPLAYTEFTDVVIVTDIYKGKGALGGIYSGLFYASHQYSFVAACDMPFLNKNFIIYLISQAQQYDIIVPVLDDISYSKAESARCDDSNDEAKRMISSGSAKVEETIDKVYPPKPARFQPLHAIYSKNCLIPIKRLINADKLKITGFYKESRLLQISGEKIKQHNQDGRLFLNINTPEDLKQQQNNSLPNI